MISRPFSWTQTINATCKRLRSLAIRGLRRRLSYSLCLAAFASFFRPPVAGQDELPRIGTLGAVEASNFSQTLSQGSQSEVQNFMAYEVAGHCSNYFGYCRWLPLTNANDTTNLTATLKVALAGEKSSIGFPIDLRFSAVVKGQTHALQGVPHAAVYETTDLTQPTHDAERLKRDIQAVLRAFFENDASRAKMHEIFLAQIPISKKLDVRSKRLVIPLQRSVLPAAEGSVFAARFKAQPPTESAFQISIKMEAEHGTLNSPVECRLLEFRHADPGKSILAGGWADVIEASCTNAIGGVIPVYVERYKRLSPLNEGLFLDPR